MQWQFELSSTQGPRLHKTKVKKQATKKKIDK